MEKYFVQIIHMIVCGSPRQGLAQQAVSKAAETSSRQSMSRTCISMHTTQQVEDPTSLLRASTSLNLLRTENVIKKVEVLNCKPEVLFFALFAQIEHEISLAHL